MPFAQVALVAKAAVALLSPCVLSFPFQLRFLFANRPQVMSHVLGIVYRVIETYLIHQARLTRSTANTGSVSCKF